MGDESDIAGRIERIEVELESIRQYYDKSVSYSQNNDPAAALWMARKAAEAICAELFRSTIGKPPKNASLDVLIDKLVNQEAIPRNIQVPLRTIQTYGNFGTHHQLESKEPITPEYAQPCLQALATVVRWYFHEHGGRDVTTPPPGPEGGRADPRRRPPALLIAGLAGGAIAAALALLAARDWPERRPPAPAAAANDATARGTRLAILPFESLSSDTSDTSGYEEGIVRILEKPLTAAPDLDIVERADIDKAIGELKLTRDRIFDQSTVSRIGRLVGAQRLLLGSYVKIGTKLRIDARVIDVETGRILASVAREGRPDDLTALVTAIGEELAASRARPPE